MSFISFGSCNYQMRYSSVVQNVTFSSEESSEHFEAEKLRDWIVLMLYFLFEYAWVCYVPGNEKYASFCPDSYGFSLFCQFVVTYPTMLQVWQICKWWEKMAKETLCKGLKGHRSFQACVCSYLQKKIKIMIWKHLKKVQHLEEKNFSFCRHQFILHIWNMSSKWTIMKVTP